MLNITRIIYQHMNNHFFTVRTMTHKVFVYGTLKRSEPNHFWLTRPNNGESKFISEGTTKTKYPLIIAARYNIPFLLYSPGEGHHVKGEIYEVDDKMLSQLDILEDHPNNYEREKDDIAVIKPDTNATEIHQCWVYFMKNFKQDLLSLPRMESYSSTGSHGLVYMDRSKLDPNYKYSVDIKERRT